MSILKTHLSFLKKKILRLFIYLFIKTERERQRHRQKGEAGSMQGA